MYKEIAHPGQMATKWRNGTNIVKKCNQFFGRLYDIWLGYEYVDGWVCDMWICEFFMINGNIYIWEYVDG